jgi:predicted  nucleic acid-binding Zn-ribbon protein
MSAKERPEAAAFRELEGLVRHLGEELAAHRRRALQAETQLKERASAPSRGKALSPERASAMEAENSVLKTRLGNVEDRVKQMVERVRFLRQQLQTQSAVSAR